MDWEEKYNKILIFLMIYFASLCVTTVTKYARSVPGPQPGPEQPVQPGPRPPQQHDTPGIPVQSILHMRTGYFVFSKSEAGRLSGPSADFSLNKIIIVVFMGLGCSPTIFPFFCTLFVHSRM